MEENNKDNKEIVYVYVEKEKSKLEKDYEEISDIKNWIPFIVFLSIFVVVGIIVMAIVLSNV